MYNLPLTAEDIKERLLKIQKLSADAATHGASYESASELIRVDLGYTIEDGSEIKFKAPIDGARTTGLIIYYPDAEDTVVSTEFAFADANGNNVGAVDNLFAENAVVKVILDLDTNNAFVQNADTNKYLEERFDNLKTDITEVIYKQNEAPTDVEDGTLWVDMDEEGMSGGSGTTDYTNNIGIINPDMVTGANGEELTTDSAKLQRCFDLLSTSGGVISINRTYTLTEDVVISHDSSAHNNLIVVKGDGQVPRIDFGSYCFRGTAGKHSCGGVIFKDMRITGEGIGFDCTTLIRLTFDNCMIRRFTNFIHSSDYAQSIYFMGCYIRSSLDATVKTIYTPDLKIIGCVCEAGSGLINVSDSMDGCSITDCCIEGYNSTPIILPSKCHAVNISNNYFETNKGVNIDATATSADASLSITNNLFTEYQGEDETIGAIALPPTISDGAMIVSGNRCAYSNSILLKVPDNATDLSKVYAFGNYGTTNNPDKVKMLMPADIQKAVIGPIKGEDYWTASDKEEMVHNVLEEMSGETWQFELSDGTTFERTVATASLTEFDSEAWTFTLADGSIVSKEVAIV